MMKAFMSKWEPMVRVFLKDPLAHLLLLGLGLFVLNGVVNPGGDLDRVIVVDRPSLLAYMQRDTKNFDAEWAARSLDGLSAEDHQFLIERYVWDEALYRLALAQGMERTDDGVRERLVEKMEFIATSGAPVVESLSDEDVAAYFEANKESYYIPPQVSFTHVFYSYAEHGVEGAVKKADAVLEELREFEVSFERAKDYGDEYAFHTDYVGASRDIVSAHFSEQMADVVFAPEMAPNQWLGPYESLNGVHLVMVSKLEEGHVATLEEVPWVRSDALADLRYKQDVERVQAVIDQYRVQVELD